MNIDIERIPLSGSALARAYIDDFPRVARFYDAGPPTRLDSYRRVMEQARQRRDAPDWERLAEAYDGEDDALRARLQEVIRSRGLFVATGQQAGLFVSPLLTVYKALTAARLARQLETQLGLPVMPMFTVASEDHDWEEANHTHVVDVENQLVRLQVEGPSGGEGPSPSVEAILLGADIEDVLSQLTQLTPDSEFKSSVLDPLRDAYRPGRSVAFAFQDALGHLLRRHQFLICRTAHPYVKLASREVLWREWEERESVQAGLLRRVEELEDAGYAAQVGVSAGATNLFLDGRLGRDRILFEGSKGRLRRSEETLSGKQLRRILDEEPGRVSPGALLRPVTEAAAFPVVAYVGGPSEIAYLAQSQVLFELHEVAAPVVVPRSALRLVESKVSRVLEKYGVASDQLAGNADAAIARLLQEEAPAELKGSLEALRATAEAALEEVAKSAAAFDPGSKSAVDRGRNAVLGGIRDLEKRLQARVKEKNQVMQQQLEKVAVNLYPGGRPQERVLSPYPYLVRYGEKLLDAIFEKVVTPLD